MARSILKNVQEAVSPSTVLSEIRDNTLSIKDLLKGFSVRETSPGHLGLTLPISGEAQDLALKATMLALKNKYLSIDADPGTIVAITRAAQKAGISSN